MSEPHCPVRGGCDGLLDGDCDLSCQPYFDALKGAAPSESSASLEPRCDHGSNWESPLIRGECRHPECFRRPPSAPGGSSRHSDGAAPAFVEALFKALHVAEEETGSEVVTEALALLPFALEAAAEQPMIERLRALGYLVHKPDLSSPAIPDDRAVLEVRVRALLIEQIAAHVEALAADQCSNDFDPECPHCWAFAQAISAVRSFATPGDDRTERMASGLPESQWADEQRAAGLDYDEGDNL